MAKLAPGDLAQVLSKLPKQMNENVIVGFDTADDAGVFRLSDSVALVQTVDFFTPVADDPETYGRVAAINSLNDIYAMGGRPLTALSVVCYPQKGDWDVLAKILLGGQNAMSEAGVAILGGHSVDDQEMKFGYAVTGTIDPNRVITNAGAKPGDILLLTKPIGTGAINTAVKRGVASEKATEACLAAMSTSARAASEAMVSAGANGCTDVTGFGLLGHAFEMARASGVTFRIQSSKVPLLPDVVELVEQGMLTRGDRNNRIYVDESVAFDGSVSATMQSILFDPQTAGGLLISISEAGADKFLTQVPEAAVVGRVVERADVLITVE
ncbi:selenide, water dikinase SelD [Leptolyngbya sp. 7M]|uniref:selenide, water dikinase SelD n=1 Tax=Leptolyngbya sp. 7M TaxID=2812896 RepID=UPI001B8C24E5|nr:selenide, water dikinase SelD [Leptolyngbya sp. 7M]QYO66233.1 selenide, water dikinase SelD [Leptolyngbya sp. 7M]